MDAPAVMVCFQRPFREGAMLPFFSTHATRRCEAAGTSLVSAKNPTRLPARFGSADPHECGIPVEQAAVWDPQIRAFRARYDGATSDNSVAPIVLVRAADRKGGYASPQHSLGQVSPATARMR
jgi:hypothetical protein